jgi:hypothetical protein
MLREIHDPHSTFTDELGHAVVAEGLADHAVAG